MDIIQKIINKKDNKIYMIGSPVSRERLTHLERVVIAMPDERSRDIMQYMMEVNSESTPSIPNLSNPQAKESIETYFKHGLMREANGALGSLLDQAKKPRGFAYNPTKRDGELIKEYREKIKYARASRTPITTFDTGMLADFHQNTIIFYGDPIDLFYRVDSINVSELVKLKERNREQPLIRGWGQENIVPVPANYAEKAQVNTFTVPPLIALRHHRNWAIKLIGHDVSGKILPFIFANHFVKDANDNIVFHRKIDILEDKQIIILSEKADPHTYSRIFGDRLHSGFL